jgi:hypothetical protein
MVCLAAAWFVLARHSSYFIGPLAREQYAEVGDVVPFAGPYVHFPEGDMYLMYKNAHALPWLFRWTAEDLEHRPTAQARMDWRGHLHALAPGIVDVFATPRGGRGFGTTRVVILPRLAAFRLRVSRDTLGVGDTLTVGYDIIQAGGARLELGGMAPIPVTSNERALYWVSRANGGGRFVARKPGPVTLTAVIGHRIAHASVVIR